MIKFLLNIFKRKKENIELDPDNRDWEYDGDGTKIYKVEKGYGHKTPVESDLKQFNHRIRKDSEKMTDIQKMDAGFNGKTYTNNGIEGDF
jgi:hypothetical protein